MISVFATLTASAAKITKTGVTVAQAAALQADATVASFTITDKAANVLAGLSGLVADSKLKSITLSDATPPVFTLGGQAYVVDASVLGKISSPYSLVITGSNAAQAAASRSVSTIRLNQSWYKY